MRKRVLILGILGSLILGAILPITTFAAGATGTNITTSPVSSDLRVSPGGSIATTLSILNNSSQPIAVQLQLQTFKPYGTNGQAKVTPVKPGSDFINWVHFSQTSLIAQPGVWEHVQMTLTPPATAALDYYYAVLVKPTVTTSPTLHTTTTLKGYNAILVLLDVASPNAKPILTVSNFSTNHGLYEYLPASFSITSHNTGNVFLAPTGDIYISKDSGFKNVIATIPVNTGQGNVIPGSARTFTNQWKDGFPLFVPKTVDGQPIPGSNGQPIDQLKWDFTQVNKFRFGRYYAKMVFVYNNGTRDIPISAVVSFWVIPWKIGALVLFIVSLCAVGLYASGRKLVARTARLKKKKDTPPHNEA
jgi:hypothetical protein